MKLFIVRDVLNHKFVYINIERILSIEIKPLVKVDGIEKEALAAIIMDSIYDIENNSNIIYIDETAEDLFKRISIGTGCINLDLDHIPRMCTE